MINATNLADICGLKIARMDFKSVRTGRVAATSEQVRATTTLEPSIYMYNLSEEYFEKLIICSG